MEILYLSKRLSKMAYLHIHIHVHVDSSLECIILCVHCYSRSGYTYIVLHDLDVVGKCLGH